MAESTAQALDVLAGFWEEVELLADLGPAVENGSMVSAAEETADLCQGAASVVSEEVHGDLTGIGELAVAVSAGEELAAEVEVATDRGDDSVGCGQRRREV